MFSRAPSACQAESGERILVIDDDKGIGAAIQSTLDAEGYRPVYVESAEESIQQGLSSAVNLVVPTLDCASPVVLR